MELEIRSTAPKVMRVFFGIMPFWILEAMYDVVTKSKLGDTVRFSELRCPHNAQHPRVTASPVQQIGPVTRVEVFGESENLILNWRSFDVFDSNSPRNVRNHNTLRAPVGECFWNPRRLAEATQDRTSTTDGLRVMDVIAMTLQGVNSDGEDVEHVLWGIVEQEMHVTRKRSCEGRKVTEHFPNEIRRLIVQVRTHDYDYGVDSLFAPETPLYLVSLMCFGTSQYMKSCMLLDTAFKTRPDLFSFLVGLAPELTTKAAKISPAEKWALKTSPQDSENTDPTMSEVKSNWRPVIMLIQGPPGTGKTTLLCGITKELQCHTFNVAQTKQAVRNLAYRRFFLKSAHA